MDAMALSVSGLLSSDYEHRTCLMHRGLLSEVRLAMQALPDTTLAEELCQKVLELLPRGDAAVMLSPAMGTAFVQSKPIAVASFPHRDGSAEHCSALPSL